MKLTTKQNNDLAVRKGKDKDGQFVELWTDDYKHILTTMEAEQAPIEARAESEEVAMSNATDMHKHETRMMLANSITSVLVYRFPWLRVNATADNALRAYLVSKHDSGLTIESAMGAMLDALQAENAEVKRQFVAYVNNHGPCQVR